jgi:hypothetical protein
VRQQPVVTKIDAERAEDKQSGTEQGHAGPTEKPRQKCESCDQMNKRNGYDSIGLPPHQTSSTRAEPKLGPRRDLEPVAYHSHCAAPMSPIGSTQFGRVMQHL